MLHHSTEVPIQPDSLIKRVWLRDYYSLLTQYLVHIRRFAGAESFSKIMHLEWSVWCFVHCRRCWFGMELISTALGNNSVRKKTFAQTAQVDLESAWLLVESMYRPRHDWISASEGRSRKLWWMEVPSNSSYCAFWCCRVLSWATGVVRSWSRNTMPRSHAMSLIWKDFEQHKLGPFYTSVIQFWGSS